MAAFKNMNLHFPGWRLIVASSSSAWSRAVCIPIVDTAADFGRVASYDGESRDILLMSVTFPVWKRHGSNTTYLMQ